MLTSSVRRREERAFAVAFAVRPSSWLSSD